MFCPIFMPSVRSRFFGFDESRFFGFTMSRFFCQVNKLIAAIDTSSGPPENTPKSSLHLHCSVKTRTESSTFQLSVTGADAEIPVGTVEGGGGGGGQSPALHYTLHNLNYTTHSIIFLSLCTSGPSHCIL